MNPLMSPDYPETIRTLTYAVSIITILVLFGLYTFYLQKNLPIDSKKKLYFAIAGQILIICIGIILSGVISNWIIAHDYTWLTNIPQ